MSSTVADGLDGGGLPVTPSHRPVPRNDRGAAGPRPRQAQACSFPPPRALGLVHVRSRRVSLGRAGRAARSRSGVFNGAVLCAQQPRERPLVVVGGCGGRAHRPSVDGLRADPSQPLVPAGRADVPVMPWLGVDVPGVVLAEQPDADCRALSCGLPFAGSGKYASCAMRRPGRHGAVRGDGPRDPGLPGLVDGANELLEDRVGVVLGHVVSPRSGGLVAGRPLPGAR